MILGLETSCDETSAAVITEEGDILSNVVASQTELDAHRGGVEHSAVGEQSELIGREIDEPRCAQGPSEHAGSARRDRQHRAFETARDL